MPKKTSSILAKKIAKKKASRKAAAEPKDSSLDKPARRQRRFGLAERARRVRLRRKQPKQSWIWDAACSIRGAKDAPKYKDFILPLIFTKRLCDVFDDEVNRIAAEVGSRKKAFQLEKNDYDISPSRYIHSSDAEAYRLIAESVDELDAIELKAKESDKALREIFKQLGV